MATTNTRVRSTKKYKTLIALGISDERALLRCGVEPVTAPAEADTATQDLLDAGFSEDEVAEIKSEVDGATVETVVAAKPKTPKDVADELVEAEGLRHTRGLVYASAAIIEAQARVMKTSSPEVIKTSGVGHTKAVVVYKADSGEVGVQNLVPQA